jgi:hypothetical protein
VPGGGHIGRNWIAFVQNLANRSSRDAKHARELILCQSCCPQNILAQNLAGMRRLSLAAVQPIVRDRFNSINMVFEVNIEDIFT